MHFLCMATKAISLRIERPKMKDRPPEDIWRARRLPGESFSEVVAYR